MTLQGGKTEYAAQGIDGIVEFVLGNMVENAYYKYVFKAYFLYNTPCDLPISRLSYDKEHGPKM